MRFRNSESNQTSKSPFSLKERTPDGQSVPFQGVFDMRVEAGLEHDIVERIRRCFRLMRPEDDPIFFDPSRLILSTIFCSMSKRHVLSGLIQIDIKDIGCSMIRPSHP
jgi:hypothetical protein